MKDDYSDIIHLPHKQSDTRPHMSAHDRAAQFAPFAALVGHDRAIDRMAELTANREDMSDSAIEEIKIRLDAVARELGEI